MKDLSVECAILVGIKMCMLTQLCGQSYHTVSALVGAESSRCNMLDKQILPIVPLDCRT